MGSVGRLRAILARVARVAALASSAMLAASVYATFTSAGAAAADGPQGTPTLLPESVPTANDAFTVVPPMGAYCEEDGTGTGPDSDPGPKSGAENWRWHSFIVEDGRDLSTLQFGPYGPGPDFDATDGEISAGLIREGNGVWEELPALKPEGHINPNKLGGVMLDPATYTLVDGDYLLGFACTDDTAATRQWWSVAVTINTTGTPFLTVKAEGAAPAGPAVDHDASSESVGNPPGAVSAAGDVDAATPVTPVSAAGDTDLDDTDLDLASPPTPSGTVDDVISATGVSWAPVAAVIGTPGPIPNVVWAVLALVFLRAAYLLSTPVRVVSPHTP